MVTLHGMMTSSLSATYLRAYRTRMPSARSDRLKMRRGCRPKSAVAKQHRFNLRPDRRHLRTSRTRFVLEHRDNYRLPPRLADVYTDAQLARLHHDGLDESSISIARPSYGDGPVSPDRRSAVDATSVRRAEVVGA
jgi:hypothetical protein